MVISEKQHRANIGNAQHSTGPKTPEGKAAVRHNAGTHSLRSRAIILPREDPAAYARIWDRLEADWRPQTNTEWCYLESMVTSQWLLTRAAETELCVYSETSDLDKQLRLLSYVYKQRAQLERSFRTAIADMKQTQKERQSQPQTEKMQQNATPNTGKNVASQAPGPVSPPPAYVMSEAAAIHPVVCAPAATDSR